MKKFILLLVMLGCLIPSLAEGLVIIQPSEPIEVTKEMALEAAKRALGEEGQVMLYNDYYLIEDNDSVQWSLFVDYIPDAGWEHKCYIATVPKIMEPMAFRFVPAELTETNCPPDVDMTLLAGHITLRFNTSQKPYVAKGELSLEEQEAANRTYAIILNGGINKNANHERNWNDCSFIYQTLVKKHGVPKDNVSVLMADGADPADDMRLYDLSYGSSPLDLDFDGLPDVQYAATVDNLKNVIVNLKTKMGKDDHLLFFVAGAGGSTIDGNRTPHIRLWGEERVAYLALDVMLSPLISKGITFNAVLGQSYGGDFLLESKGIPGSVWASATDEAGAPFACHNKPYREFLYQWTSAVNGADSRGDAVEADSDGDGFVSMSEASSFAKNSISASQYVSTPPYIGGELAFGNLAESGNLFIKDDYSDDGAEPNRSFVFWDSPSIWVRNRDDGVAEHECLLLSENRGTAYVYVKIHNRGKAVTGGKGRRVDLYWSQASTAVDDRVLSGGEMSGDWPTGGYIGYADIGDIATGESAVVKVEWSLPPCFKTLSFGVPQPSIGARIADKRIGYSGLLDLDAALDNHYMLAPAKNRCDALKSVSVIPFERMSTGEGVYVRNPEILSGRFSLSLMPRTLGDGDIFSEANVDIDICPVLRDAWRRGGSLSNGVTQLPLAGSSFTTLRFTNKLNLLYGIEMHGRDLAKTTLRVTPRRQPLSRQKYVLDLVQRDADNHVVGAVTFVLQKSVQAGATEAMSLSVEPYGSEDADMPYDYDNSIRCLSSASAVADRLVVELESPAADGASLLVTSVLSAEGCVAVDVPPGESSAEINVGALKPGIYILTYAVNGTAVDTVKFTKV